jgi:uracil-DNA glycosylase family 4
MAAPAKGESAPPPDCGLCPRLAAYRKKNRKAHPDWHNAPVPSFAPADTPVRLLVVGLAPGLKGANRTGRPFTGDYAGEVLYPMLLKHGFARGRYGASPDDTLKLRFCRVTNAVRCVPPENKPTPREAATCNRFLAAEIAELPELTAILALGQVAHGAALAALGLRKSARKFKHGATHAVEAAGRKIWLADSYHCSRYNLNTGRLTEAMFDAVIREIAKRLKTGTSARRGKPVSRA